MSRQFPKNTHQRPYLVEPQRSLPCAANVRERIKPIFYQLRTVFLELGLSPLCWQVHTPQGYCPPAVNRYFQFGFQRIKLSSEVVLCISPVPFNITQTDSVLSSAGSQVEKTIKIKQKNSMLCCMTTQWAPTAHISIVPVILI